MFVCCEVCRYNLLLLLAISDQNDCYQTEKRLELDTHTRGLTHRNIQIAKA